VSADLRVTVAGLELRNPVIAGSCEATATAEDIRACIAAGAAAVVAKSVNESVAARDSVAVRHQRLEHFVHGVLVEEPAVHGLG